MDEMPIRLDDSTDSSEASFFMYNILVWTLCLMHKCVIPTMFGSFYLFYYFFMSFLFLLLFCKIKLKCFFFTFVILFICMQVWSLEKKDAPHSFSSTVFFKIINFIFSYFLLFIWFLLFSNSFLLARFYCISLSLFHLFPLIF